jgi:4-diphosphocytidyl-2-C-methyl-D-erythritol kinase
MVKFLTGSFKEASYAKINLSLQVIGKRADGFHNIVSLFQLIDLHDDVTITLKESDNLIVSCSPIEEVNSMYENSAYQAALLFAQKVALVASIDINLKKRIPTQAGLGGASSNAATVLLLLNRLCYSPLNFEQLKELALQLGSDIPFFLYQNPLALITGRGEHITLLKGRSDLNGLIVMPNFLSVDTSNGYSSLEKFSYKFADYYNELINSYRLNVSSWPFENDFRAPLNKKTDLYHELDNKVKTEGNCFGSLSGSGSSYYILSENKETINRIEADLLNSALDIAVYKIKCLHPRQIFKNLYLY